MKRVEGGWDWRGAPVAHLLLCRSAVYTSWSLRRVHKRVRRLMESKKRIVSRFFEASCSCLYHSIPNKQPFALRRHSLFCTAPPGSRIRAKNSAPVRSFTLLPTSLTSSLPSSASPSFQTKNGSTSRCVSTSTDRSSRSRSAPLKRKGETGYQWCARTKKRRSRSGFGITGSKDSVGWNE